MYFHFDPPTLPPKSNDLIALQPVNGKKRGLAALFFLARFLAATEVCCSKTALLEISPRGSDVDSMRYAWACGCGTAATPLTSHFAIVPALRP